MKSLVTLAVLYDLTSLSTAHSVASHLIVDGKWTGLWQHVLYDTFILCPLSPLLDVVFPLTTNSAM
jgi:hypothetical protein